MPTALKIWAQGILFICYIQLFRHDLKAALECLFHMQHEPLSYEHDCIQTLCGLKPLVLIMALF